MAKTKKAKLDLPESPLVPEKDAIDRVKAWRKFDWKDKEGNSLKTKAYLISIVDIGGVLGLLMALGGTHIRAYLANNEGENELLLVGVDDKGLDIMDGIFDLTTPCPNMCDDTSPLFTLKEKEGKTKRNLKDLTKSKSVLATKKKVGKK